MKTLFLSLMFLVGVSFTGMQTTATASSGCTNCWAFANSMESMFHPGGNFDTWLGYHDLCQRTAAVPCSHMLDPVTF